jgi:S-DNA-T family DNA segregation ATPase FtsK/SpoIIIE
VFRADNTGNLKAMASRTSGKGNSRQRAGGSAGAAKKAPAKKAPAKKAPAKKPAGKAPAKKAAKPAPPPAPSPTAGVYRLTKALWLGLAHTVGAMLRGIGRGAKGLDPAHRKDGLALLLLGLALIVAAGTWSNLQGPVGDLVAMLVTGAFGRLDLVVPVLLGAIAVRLIRHPEQPEANGRIVIGLSALVVGVLGLVHLACGAPGRGEGDAAISDAGGLVGWAASRPLIVTVGEALAVPLLVLVTVFGLLVVTATPVNAIPQRVRQLAVRLGLLHPTAGEAAEAKAAAYADDWRQDVAPDEDPYDDEDLEERPAPRRRTRRTRTAPPAPVGGPVGDPVDIAAAAAADLDGAVLHGVQPSPLLADLSSGITAERMKASLTGPRAIAATRPPRSITNDSGNPLTPSAFFICPPGSRTIG